MPTEQETKLLDIIAKIKLDSNGLTKDVKRLNSVLKRSLQNKKLMQAIPDNLKSAMISSVKSTNEALGKIKTDRLSAWQQSIVAKERVLKTAVENTNKIRMQGLNEARATVSNTLGLSLSTMFLAQEIANKLARIEKDLFTTYMKVSGQTSEFGNSINRLQASFTFLKFSIVNAFASSKIGQSVINMLTKMTDAFAELVNKHPKLGVDLVIGGTVVSKAADFASLGAQLWMWYSSLKIFRESQILKAVIKAGADASQMDSIVGKLVSTGEANGILKTTVKIGSIVAGAGLAFDAATGIFNATLKFVKGEKGGFDTVAEDIKNALQGVAGLSLIGGNWQLGITLLIGKVAFDFGYNLGQKLYDWVDKHFPDISKDLQDKATGIISNLNGVNLDSIRESIRRLKELNGLDTALELQVNPIDARSSLPLSDQISNWVDSLTSEKEMTVRVNFKVGKNETGLPVSSLLGSDIQYSIDR